MPPRNNQDSLSMSASNTVSNAFNLQQAATSIIGTFPAVDTSGSFNYNVTSVPTTGSNLVWTIASDTNEPFISNNEKMISLLVTVLKESELREVLGRISLLKNETENWKKLLLKIVRSRHLSQEFLMTYIENLTYDDIKIQHYSDLATGEYSEVFLYFNLK